MGDTARHHHQVIDQAEAEGSEINRAQERGHRKEKAGAKAKAKVGESSLKRPFQFKKYAVVTQIKEHLILTFLLGGQCCDEESFVNMADFGDDPEIEGDVLAVKRSPRR